jgi:hypothetical protein
MSFQPIIPLSGVPGWKFLARTQEKQQAAFERSPEIKRDLEYFEKNIGKIETAADLVKDRRLLKIALGAFGLEGEIDKKAFIRKVLESGTEESNSLANRLTASGIKDFVNAFGFGNTGGSRIGEAGFSANIVAQYKTRAFEGAVGDADNDLRLAMNFRREMAELAKGETGASIFKIIGSKPLRTVLEKAFNLPSDFANIDVDLQKSTLEAKIKAQFGKGDLTVFGDPANVEKAISRFLVRSQIDANASANSPAATALTLLRNSRVSSQGLSNLLASRG